MYSISIANQGRLTSFDILKKLDPNNPYHAKAAARIGFLERHGCQYAGHDFDVLSHTLSLLHREV